MNKIFLSTSFSGKVNYDTGEVLPEFRQEIEVVLHALRTNGADVFAAIEYEGWRVGNIPSEVGVKADIEQIDAADVLLALLHDQPSAGVQFEIGYAVAQGKRVILASQTELAYFNQGLVGLGKAEHIHYESPKDIVTKLS